MNLDVVEAIGGVALALVLVWLSLVFLVVVDEPNAWSRSNVAPTAWRLLAGLTHLGLVSQLFLLVNSLRTVATWL